MIESSKNCLNKKTTTEKKTDIIELENNKYFDNLNNVEDIVDIKDIINYISTNLLSIIQENKHMKKKPLKENEPLYSKLIPILSLEKYLIRIIKYTEAENNTIIFAYLYIIKLIKSENFILSLNNIYRLLLGSVVLAQKFLEDLKYNNSYYCQIGGMSLQEFNKIEYSLFIRLNYDVNIEKDQIVQVYKNIIKFKFNKINENSENIQMNINKICLNNSNISLLSNLNISEKINNRVYL